MIPRVWAVKPRRAGQPMTTAGPPRGSNRRKIREKKKKNDIRRYIEYLLYYYTRLKRVSVLSTRPNRRIKRRQYLTGYTQCNSNDSMD